jgi:hypothetical protein
LIGGLYSVEVVQWSIPIDRDGFFAFRISANTISFDNFAVKTASQRLLKRICGMHLIWRCSFKNPVTIGAFEGKFGCRHNTPFNH